MATKKQGAAESKTKKEHHSGRKDQTINSKTFVDIDQVRKTPKKCSRCKKTLEQGRWFVFLERHRHTFVVCSACAVLMATELVQRDPLAKTDAMVENCL